MKRQGTIFLLICILAVSVSALDISGTVVTSEASGRPVEGVVVKLAAGGDSVITDAEGSFSLQDLAVNDHFAAVLPVGFDPSDMTLLTPAGKVISGAAPDGMYIGTWQSGDAAYRFRVVVAGGKKLIGAARTAASGIRAKSAADPVTVLFSHKWFQAKDMSTAGGSVLSVVMTPKDSRPTQYNTGALSSGLTAATGLSITSAGAVISGRHFTGTVSIKANNVTLRDFKINANGASYGIKIESGLSGIVIEDGEIYNMASCAILGMGFTARRLYIHDSNGDGMKAQGTGGAVLVEGCFFEKMGKADGAHADGNQTRGGKNITFRANNIYMPYPGTPEYPGTPYKSNAAFMLQLTISNFVIENNWLNGGNYTIYSPGGVTVRNNIFGRYNRGWTEGTDELHLRSGSFDAWTGNVWEDTGTACP